ncbi:MAG: alpha/beta fold hydrolase [Phycisphaeraceae bacterium]|nr:MAG: alpha/beta fold hydrolase [Phycisphaeraceae bacterium]
MTHWIRSHPRLILSAYLVALILSHVAESIEPRSWFMLPAVNRSSVTVPAMTDDGPTDRSITLSYLEFGPADDPRPPVILIHGSPGQATDFVELGPTLADLARRTFALDMPGFGMSSPWVPSYSARAYARTVLAFMDAKGIDRAHLVGWSNGGAVVLNVADIAPDRLASLTMLAAIGAQEEEGSGNYYFEHAKYAVGYAGLVVLPDFTPHFGLFFPREYRHAFIRNFWDTDQRPLRDVMQHLEVPVLILHGRHDPLVAAWAAEHHHALIPTSKLIMTPFSHFMPFLHPREVAGYLGPFFTRHDTPGVAPETGTLDLAPVEQRTGFAGVLDDTLILVRDTPWWAMIIVFAILARLRRETATALAGIFVGVGVLDFGVAFAGLVVGRALHPREPWLKKNKRWLVGLPFWTAISLLITLLLSGLAPANGEWGLPGFIAWIIAAAWLLNVLKLAPTRVGRARLVACIRSPFHHEWWPRWAIYTAMLPHFLRLAVRHRSFMCWTCVNPGIRPAGGVGGESKDGITRGFRDDRVLHQVAIEPGPDRAHRAREALRTNPALAGFPIMVKPNEGQRGDNVVCAHNEREFDEAVASIKGLLLLQRYHPGPVETGLFWIRNVETVGHESTDKPQGHIFAVTRKVFPTLEGDGRHTIRWLIVTNRRFTLQARAYLRNLEGRHDDVLAKGERVPIANRGNHTKGCLFKDAPELVTPELSESIDRAARTWRGPNGEPFDTGRFDVRCTSEEDLKAARNIAIIELNGVTSESSNMYDPDFSVRRGLGQLARQWTHTFELGAARKAAGARPMGPIKLVLELLR